MWGHSSPGTAPALLTRRVQRERGFCAKKHEPKMHSEVSSVIEVDKCLDSEKEQGVQPVLPRCASSRLHCT